MRKKYSDPLMFSAVMLAGISAAVDSYGHSITPVDPPPGGDDEWDENDTTRGVEPDVLLVPADTPDPISEPITDPVEIVEPEVSVEVPTVMDELTGEDTGAEVAPGTGD